MRSYAELPFLLLNNLQSKKHELNKNKEKH